MMTLKQVYAEIQETAKVMASLGEYDLAAKTMQVMEALGTQTLSKTASKIEGLDPLGSTGWWLKPHNLVLASSGLGWNLWTFTILPYFPTKRAARLDLNGIVIRPIWRVSRFGPDALTPEHVRDTRALIEKFPSVTTTVSRELSWIEHEFDVEVPQNIRDTLVAASMRQAQSRWGTPHWRVADRLIPLDGAMPRDVS